MNPWLIAAVLFIEAAIAAGSFASGWKVNEWRIHDQDRKAEAAVKEAGQQMREAAVIAIARIQPKYTTIQGKVERETISVPVYRDCTHTDATWGLLSEAYEAAGAGPLPGAHLLPEPSAPSRP